MSHVVTPRLGLALLQVRRSRSCHAWTWTLDALSTSPTRTAPYLLQLLLHHALLLRHVLELLRVLLGELPAGLLGGALLGRQGLLRLPVRADLLLQVLLLHLKELLGLLEPFFILLTL